MTYPDKFIKQLYKNISVQTEVSMDKKDFSYIKVFHFTLKHSRYHFSFYSLNNQFLYFLYCLALVEWYMNLAKEIQFEYRVAKTFKCIFEIHSSR